jgi:DNA-binding SARP family transcriptional activator
MRRRVTVAEFAILGSLVVTAPSGRIEIGGPRRRALLLRLLLSANEVVPTEELIDDVWGEIQPRTVVKSLQVQVGRLRRQFADAGMSARLVTRPAGYSLEMDDNLLDARHFERLARTGSQALADGSPTLAAGYLHDALDLWRGRALLDVENLPFARVEITRLEQLRLWALEERFEAELALGEHGSIVAELESFTGAHSLRERAWGQLMITYYRCGRQADALRAYQRASERLAEIGIEPNAELRSLERQLLDQAPSLDWQPAQEHQTQGGPAPASSELHMGPLPLPAAAITRSPIVGRAGQMRRVAQSWERSCSGQRQVLLLEGDPGIGKTRVAAEAAAWVVRSGGVALWGPCDESPTNPYQPFTEALEHLFRNAPDDQIKVLAGPHPDYLAPVVPGLIERLGDVLKPASHNSDHDRFLVLDAVATVLTRLAADRPTLVVLDDLHWAPPPTVLMLRHWLSRSRLDATMLVASYRPAELDANRQVRSLVTDLLRDGDTSTLTLDELGLDDVESLVGDAGDPIVTPERLARFVHARTRGNPLLSTQLLRSYADATADERQRLLASGGDSAVVGAVPSTIRHMIRDRLDRLSADAVEAVRVGAVLGMEFELSVLERVLERLPDAGDRSGGAVLPALERAVRARLLDERAGTPRFGFVHALVRDSVYRDLSLMRRARLHRGIADVLVELGHPAPLVAHHYRLAVPDGARSAALEWSERAARDLMDRFAYEDARRVFDSAMELLDEGLEVDRSTRARLELMMARCAELSGDRADWLRLAERAVASARSSRSLETLVHAAMDRAGYGQADVYDEVASTLLRQALDAVGDDRPDLRALVLSRFALAEKIGHGRVGRTDDLAAEAVDLARESGEPSVLYLTLATRVHMTPSLRRLDEQWALLDEMAQIERSHGGEIETPRGLLRVPFNTATRLCNEAVARLRAADIVGFDVTMAEIAERGLARRDWQLLAIAEAGRAMRALLDGRFDDVPGRLEAMSRLGGHDLNISNYSRSIRFRLAREVGTAAEMEAVVAGLRVGPRNSNSVAAALASIYIDTGQPDLAHDVMESFIPPTLDSVAGAIPASVLATFAEVCRDAHDAQRAGELYAQLLPHAGQLIVYVWGYTVTGTADRYLAMLAAELGWADEADERFASALSLEESIPAPPLAVRTKARWGEWLVQHHDERRRRRGVILLDDAARSATDMGMRLLTERIAAVTGPSSMRRTPT